MNMQAAIFKFNYPLLRIFLNSFALSILKFQPYQPLASLLIIIDFKFHFIFI